VQVPAVIDLPAPLALARLVDTITPVGPAEPVWEPKWDGYRALVAGGRIFSRRGTNLAPYFPDLVPVLTARLPRDLVLDGELVAWDPTAGRLDFAGLQARMVSGRRIHTVAAGRPAQFVAFDVLAAGGQDLRGTALRERRRALEQALIGISSPIVVCQQTADEAVARDWFETLTAAGIEGLVIKDGAAAYPTRAGQRVWWKVKARATVEMLAIGFTGSAAAPATLVLAFPGATDERGAPVAAGSTTALDRNAATAVAPLLHPTGERFARVFAFGARKQTTVHLIEPLPVEVSADASAQAGVLRHAAKLVRARPDLTVDDLV
jgi:ATP-dependent DNA ligase